VEVFIQHILSEFPLSNIEIAKAFTEKFNLSFMQDSRTHFFFIASSEADKPGIPARSRTIFIYFRISALPGSYR
jgi:hypothetical protein